MTLPQNLTQEDAAAAYCNGKVIFQTFHQAEKTAVRSRARREAKLQVYKCPICSKFHVGYTMRRKGSMKKVRQHHVEDL